MQIERLISPIACRNNIIVTGQGTQPMLFEHGFGCDQNMWCYITPAFEDDYKLILFDYVGGVEVEMSFCS